jgi:hypothetical protein
VFLSIIQVCSFIAYFPPFLPTLIILIRLFLSLNLCFSAHVYFRLFEYFLILLLLQCNDPTPQIRCLVVEEQEFMSPYARLVGPDHDLFDGCVDSALNVYICYCAPTRTTVHPRSYCLLSNLIPIVTGSCSCQP